MRAVKPLFLFLLLSLLALTGCHPMTSSTPVVYASFSEVITSSSLARQETERLSAVQKALDAGTQIAERQYASMPHDKAATARQADARLLKAQWVAEQQAARKVVLARVRTAAAELLKEKGYGIIIDRDAVLAGSTEKDVTALLVAQLKDASLDFGALPVVTPVKTDSP